MSKIIKQWSYEGSTGPDFWCDLDPAYSIAKSGKRQSPIDLSNANDTKLTPIEIYYHDTPLDVVNIGCMIQVNYSSGSYIMIDSQSYQLQQFHFHIPSEHSVDQHFYAMELHLVHQHKDGHLAVIGVFVNEGKFHSEIQKVWDALDETKSDSNSSSTVNASYLLPEDKTRFQYNGSLTNPPCSEDVLWLVLSHPIEFSKEQIDTFKSFYPQNARPIQPLNGRVILKAE